MPNWVGIHEEGKPKINRNLLFRIDSVRGLVEVVRRKVRHIIDLTDYGMTVAPESEKPQPLKD